MVKTNKLIRSSKRLNGRNGADFGSIENISVKGCTYKNVQTTQTSSVGSNDVVDLPMRYLKQKIRYVKSK